MLRVVRNADSLSLFVKYYGLPCASSLSVNSSRVCSPLTRKEEKSGWVRLRLCRGIRQWDSPRRAASSIRRSAIGTARTSPASPISPNTQSPGSSVRFLALERDRKSTRLNSSHHSNSYAVFCLKKKSYPDFLKVWSRVVILQKIYCWWTQ